MVPGVHRWLHLVIHQDDYCGRGHAWRLWNNLEIIDADQPDSDLIGSLNWLKYQGRWGNMQELVS